MIKYKKMSILDAPVDSVVAHSCNTEGKWDSGVAKALKEYSPLAFKKYEDICNYYKNNGYSLLGRCHSSYFDDIFNIANLMVSSSDSNHHDHPDIIEINTIIALDRLFTDHYKDIYMPKINSGGFGVPWEKTEYIIKLLSKRHDRNVIICDMDMPDAFDGIEIA